MLLSKPEADAIEARIARIERTVGVQVVTAIVGRSDAYPELAWPEVVQHGVHPADVI